MRIVIAGQTYDPSMGGQGVFTLHLARGMARKGHQVLVVFPSDRLRSYDTTEDGVALHGVAALPIASKVRVTPLPEPEIADMLDEFGPDIVHIQDHYPLGRATLDAAAAQRLPLVGTDHFIPENLRASLPPPLNSRRLRPTVERLLWKMMLQVYNRLDLAVTPSATAARILRQHGLLVPMRAISCGIDTSLFFRDPEVDRAAVRTRFGLDARRTLLLYTGRLEPEKRLGTLLHTLHRLDRDDIQLAIVGHGRREHALSRLVRKLELQSRVIFTGYVPAEDLNALLNSADVFVMPSDAELQSIATLEAMATGLPVLAANAGALPELVREEVNGYLFPPRDVEGMARRIAEMMDQRDRWSRMGEASLEMARPHGLSEMIRRYEQAYAEVTTRTVASEPGITR